MMNTNIIEKLTPYQSFQSADEMLRTVDAYIKTNHMTESALRVLRFISGRAKSVAGAAWLKVQTIAEAEIVGVSERTVRRAIRLLVDAGIITVHRQMRDRMGGCGANIYVINPVDSVDNSKETDGTGSAFSSSDSALVRADMSGRDVSEKPHGTSSEADNSEVKKVSVKKEINIKHSTNNVQRVDLNNQILDVSFVPETVPESFKQLAARFWGDAGTIYNLWRKAEMAANSLGCEVDEDAAIDSLKQAIFALKHRSIRGSFEGYYYGVLKQKLVQAHRAKVARQRKLFDWIR